MRIEPDEAFLWLTLTALHASAGEALSDVSTRSTALAGLLDELEIASEERSTTGITVREEFDHTPSGRQSLGHRASATVVIRLTDSGLIGRIVMRATTELDASIQGPSWRVSPDHEAWLQAATQAAAEARRKAEAYARGVDAELGPLVEMSEPGEQGLPGGLRPMRASAAAGSDLNVEAGEQEVTASVWAEFELRLPGRS